MADRTPYLRASYDAVETTPRGPTPPTMTGLPRSDGLSRCSTAAKNASRSRCRIDAALRTGPMIVHRHPQRPGSRVRPGGGSRHGGAHVTHCEGPSPGEVV